jgi:two-component system sensor histidine kinase CiaH
MFTSARVKLTLWYVLLLTGLSLLCSVVLYHFATTELSEALHGQYLQMAHDDHDADNDGDATDELNLSSHKVWVDLVYFNIAVLVLSSGAGYILARRTLQPIEEAHQAQLRFTAEASHELRTPLAAMQADTEVTLMTQGDDVTALRQALEGNLSDIEKLTKLGDHLLELSRYNSKVAVVDEPVELSEVVIAVTEQLKATAERGGLTLKVGDVSAVTRGDAQAIRRLVTIVVDNAIKYSRRGGIITLEVTGHGRFAIITVRDKGIGVGREELTHVFERFYRAPTVAGAKNMVAGYGLGLPLAKEIVEAHDGSISIHSEKEVGTTVSIRLPLL